MSVKHMQLVIIRPKGADSASHCFTPEPTNRGGTSQPCLLTGATGGRTRVRAVVGTPAKAGHRCGLGEIPQVDAVRSDRSDRSGSEPDKVVLGNRLEICRGASGTGRVEQTEPNSRDLVQGVLGTMSLRSCWDPGEPALPRTPALPWAGCQQTLRTHQAARNTAQASPCLLLSVSGRPATLPRCPRGRVRLFHECDSWISGTGVK